MSSYQNTIFPNQNFIDLGLFQFGYEKCDPSHMYGPARRNHYLFHYVLSGTGVLHAENSDGVTIQHNIEANQGFLIFPGQQTTYIADSSQPWSYVWLEYDGLRFYESLKLLGLSWDAPVYKAKFLPFRDTVRDEMLYIVEHKDEPPLHLIGHLYLFADALVRSLSTGTSTNKSSQRDFYIRETIVFIEKNYGSNITIEDLADNCGLNRSYFGRIFKQEMGQSPQAFLMSYRMIKATDMLLQTKLSVAEIGKNVGYDNQLHFSRAFKNHYGKSPLQWKKEHVNLTL